MCCKSHSGCSISTGSGPPHVWFELLHSSTVQFHSFIVSWLCCAICRGARRGRGADPVCACGLLSGLFFVGRLRLLQHLPRQLALRHRLLEQHKRRWLGQGAFLPLCFAGGQGQGACSHYCFSTVSFHVRRRVRGVQCPRPHKDESGLFPHPKACSPTVQFEGPPQNGCGGIAAAGLSEVLEPQTWHAVLCGAVLLPARQLACFRVQQVSCHAHPALAFTRVSCGVRCVRWHCGGRPLHAGACEPAWLRVSCTERASNTKAQYPGAHATAT